MQKDKKILGPCQRTKKLWDIRLMVKPVVIDALGTILKDFEKKVEGIGNPRKNQDHPEYNIIKIL